MRKFLFAFLSFALAASPVQAAKYGLSVGTKAPDFSAKTYYGKTVSLKSYLSKGPVVLIFYRGGWCPYCVKQLKEFQSKFKEFDKMGVSILAISVDMQQYANQTAYEHDLEFEVITNSRADILQKYKILTPVSGEYIKKLKSYNIDLKKASGREDAVLAIPATYVIGSDGTIAFSYANKDYTVRVTPDEVLWVLKDLK